MYKCFKIKSFSVAVHKFSATAKNVSDVYHTGIRVWESDDSKNYSPVIGVFRIIFMKDKINGECNC